MISKALEIEKLKVQLARLRRLRFGRSSEKLEREIAQLKLLLEDLESDERATAPVEQPVGETAEKRAKLRKPARRPLPAHLSRADVVHAAACTCPACGGKLGPLGEDVTEVLEYKPARFMSNFASTYLASLHSRELPSASYSWAPTLAVPR